MKTKPVIGQKLYELNIGNQARDREQTLTPVTVTKVGKKYFSVCEEEHQNLPHMHTQFHLDTWYQKTNYSADAALYTSEAEWEEERESKVLWKQLREFFSLVGKPKLSLKQLKEIASIVDN